MSFRIYQISARVVTAPVDGWQSSGRQVPTFHVAANSAESAAKTAVRVLRAAAFDAESIHATAYREEGDSEEIFSHSA